MHVIEARQRQKQITGEELETAAGVRSVILQERAAHGVGDARRGACDQRILAHGAVADDEQRGPGSDVAIMGEKRRDICRIILPVAVEGRDQRRTREANAGV